ncbi:MAG: hypothetical protein K8T26_06355 [Lentisphaerae bacterium]|nr:hypothetical protein [Lentisphaerota bacterium]
MNSTARPRTPIARPLAALACALLATSAVSARGATAVAENAGDAIVMENAAVRLVVDPARGGAIVSYIIKASGRDAVPHDRPRVGLFLDHFWGQIWPGELLDAPYTATIVATGPDDAVVRVTRTVRGEWGSARQPMLNGLVIEKTYALRGDNPALHAHIAVRNATGATRLQSYWVQHVFWAGGDYDFTADVSYRPSARGTIITANTGEGDRNDFVRDPTAGWCATVDTAKREGLAFLFDYNDTDMLYACGGNTSLEWMYDKIPVPAGRAWETDVTVLPVTGVLALDHASTHVLAAVTATRDGNTLALLHTLQATGTPVTNVAVTARVVGAADHREVTFPAIAIGALDGAGGAPAHDPTRRAEQGGTTPSDDPLAIFVTVAGETGGDAFAETYLHFYPGRYGYGANVKQDLSTPLFQIPQPEKHQVLMRPDTIVRVRQPQPEVFVLRGLHHEAFGLDEALTRFGATVRTGGYSFNMEGPRTTDFPFDYEALMRQDVIVVANANLASLGRLGLMILRDYLTHGGSLLLLGGQSAYASGGLRASGLEDLLPVTVSTNTFDVTRTDLESVRPANPPATLRGVAWDRLPPDHYYLHEVTVKPQGRVALRVGGQPLLVTGDLPGGGRVACLLAAPYGGSTNGPPGCLADPGWPEALRDLLAWLAAR